MSAEMVRVDVEPSIINGKESNMKDSSSNIRREAHVFNKYIKPEEGPSLTVLPQEYMA